MAATSDPKCNGPVGEGANLPTYLIGWGGESFMCLVEPTQIEIHFGM